LCKRHSFWAARQGLNIFRALCKGLILMRRGHPGLTWGMTAHPTQLHQRAMGHAEVRLGPAGLLDLRQQGSAKAILPHVGALPEVVFLNTSGGLTAGDFLRYGLAAEPGVRAVATTQTAERAYLAQGGQARVAVNLQVGAGGWLDWLPQETILFDRAALDRQTEIALQGSASCLMLEAVVMGRAAMGERLARVALRDRRAVLRDGRPVHLEPLVLDDAALTAGPAVLGAARAVASVVLVRQGAEDALGPVRGVLDEDGVAAAASGLDGRLVVRLMAGDGWPLRRQIQRVLAVLRRDPLPRVWQM
jgi:urease accessory protein